MNKHILIIEDEPTTAQMLMLCMKLNGFYASLAEDGDAALAFIHENSTSIDLILLDLMLPGRDGFSIYQEIAAHTGLADIPVIIQSGSSDEEIEKVRQLGALHILRKPYDNRQLISIIKQLLA